MPLREVGVAVLELDSGELTPQDLDEEIAAPARWLQETRVDTLGLALHDIQHRLDQPRRRENLAVVGEALFGLDQPHAGEFSRKNGAKLLTRGDSDPRFTLD